MRRLDLEKEKRGIIEFIRRQLKTAAKEKLVIGLSGGIDSAVTAALCSEAIGKENVISFLLPYRLSSSLSLADGKLVARELEISYGIIDISPMVDSYFDKYEPEADLLRRGNRMARERMCILYDQSSKLNALVAGTGNKSELLTGYFTQYGDGACAFEPIGHLYKTEVYELARLLGVPHRILEKKPTADLWTDQTDEEEMGISYKILDEILYNLYEKKHTREELIEKGFADLDIERVVILHNKSDFKRKLPPYPLVKEIL